MSLPLPRRFVAALLLLCAAALACLTPAVVWAQAEPAGEERPEPTKAELAAARRLFKEALRLEKKKDWEGAREKLGKVAQVIMTPQVRFHIALCDEHLGNLLDALNGFEIAAQEALKAGPKARDVAQSAPKRIAAIQQRVGHIRIVVEGRVRTSKILLDGSAISLGLLDTEIPLEPGTHQVVVEREGEIVSEHEVLVERQQTLTVELEIDDPEPPPDEKPPVEIPDEPKPKPDTPAEESSGSRVPAYIVGGTGILALGGAGVFLGLREQTIANVRETCGKNDSNCDPDMKETAELGETYTTVSYVLFGVGGAALATGVVLFFVLEPSEDDDDTASRTSPTVAIMPTGPGLQVVGSF